MGCNGTIQCGPLYSLQQCTTYDILTEHRENCRGEGCNDAKLLIVHYSETLGILLVAVNYCYIISILLLIDRHHVIIGQY